MHFPLQHDEYPVVHPAASTPHPEADSKASIVRKAISFVYPINRTSCVIGNGEGKVGCKLFLQNGARMLSTEWPIQWCVAVLGGPLHDNCQYAYNMLQVPPEIIFLDFMEKKKSTISCVICSATQD